MNVVPFIVQVLGLFRYCVFSPGRNRSRNSRRRKHKKIQQQTYEIQKKMNTPKIPEIPKTPKIEKLYTYIYIESQTVIYGSHRSTFQKLQTNPNQNTRLTQIQIPKIPKKSKNYRNSKNSRTSKTVQKHPTYVQEFWT